MIVIPLSALIKGERVIGPDLSDEAWAELKRQHKNGLEVTMVCCGARGHLRISKNGLQHFYHAQKNDECCGEAESLDHLKLKYEIYQLCKSEGWYAQPEYQSPSGDWRADVYATKGERQIVFEVQLSQIPLCDLQEREEKYHRDGIESYWILKDFLRINPHDDSKRVIDKNDGVCISDYLNYNEFLLSRETYLLIYHGVRSIGIDLRTGLLYTNDILCIETTEWVKSVLNGNYEKNLKDFEVKYRKKCQLKEIAEPILDNLGNFGYRRFDYEEDLKKFYAIFKNNKWDDRPSLQQEIREMYSTFDTFKKACGKIFSPKNGFVWDDYMGLGKSEPILDLRSEEQLQILQNQIQNLEIDEKKFLIVYNSVKEQVEKKDAENDRILQLFCGTDPQYDNPRQFRDKTIYESPEKTQKDYESEIWRKLQGNLKTGAKENEVKVQENQFLFQFLPVLPSLKITSNRGWMYQNPAGCTWKINQDDATEFEKKGYGKIIDNK